MKARKAMALAMTAAMVGGLMTVPVMAEENAKLLPGGGSKIIYCITPSTSNPFFNTEQVIAKEKAEELGYEVKCASHDDDAATQLELFEAAINDGAAAIAEVWVEAMNYEGKYAELLGLESDTNCQVRSDNYHSVIDEYEDLEMVAQQSANWDQTEAYEKTEAILQSNPEITGIICGNDTMACGAVQACLDAGRNDIKIIGLDGSDEANAYIKSGDMVGTALQQIALITEMAVEQADAYLNGTAPEEEKQLVPCVAITADNTDCLNAFVYTEPEAK